jgi:hypothetical protein
MTSTTTLSVPSTSHEYAMLSWWAAHASGASQLEMVGEETGHRPVWGLAMGAPHVRVPLPNSAVKRGSGGHILASAEYVGSTVGTLSMLRLTLPSSSRSAGGVFEAARKAYDAFFDDGGLMSVFYTRKRYETVEWQQFDKVPKRRIDSVKLADGAEAELLADARAFLASERTYARMGRPWKRVYCLHGTGKTSTAMAVASELDKDVAIFNMDSLRDDTFLEVLSERPKNAVLLFEDVDALFRQREAAGAAGGGMTFSTLLDALDGVMYPRGAIVFLTTNHLDRLDAALHRPGRVDRLVEVPLLNVEQASAMWAMFFPGTPAPAAALREACAAAGTAGNGGNGGDGRMGCIQPALLSAVLFQHQGDGPVRAAAELSRAFRATSKSRHASD